jgi:hypothetical protein
MQHLFVLAETNALFNGNGEGFGSSAAAHENHLIAQCHPFVGDIPLPPLQPTSRGRRVASHRACPALLALDRHAIM